MSLFLKTRDERSMIQGINILRFPEDYKNKLHVFSIALNYIFEYRNQTVNTILNHEIIFLSKSFLSIVEKDEKQYIECLDILSRNIKEYDFLYLNRLHETKKEFELLKQSQNNLRKLTKKKEIKIKTVYEDSQNSHNTSINKSVLKIAFELCDKYFNLLDDDAFDNIMKILFEKFPNKSEILVETMDFIKSSTTKFGNYEKEEKFITLKQVFIAVWLWISENRYFEELQSRFIEELEEMNNYCSTGHLTRLINIIQGFTETENLEIKISLKEQCDSVVKTYLMNVLSECKDERIIEGIVSGNDDFVDFIKQKVKLKAKEWVDSYGKESIQFLSNSINVFCQKEIFKRI